jgi:hypothetical protein
MTLWNETKSVPVSREMVWLAYKKVKANGGSSGIDQVSMEMFDRDRTGQLYKLWNRLASGSYFPPPVKEVEIPKKDGKVRQLGIPTIADRVAQEVVKAYLEPRFEKIYHVNSYGYRSGKSAHQALAAVRENCKMYDWVIDLDIKGFFDNIDHQKLLLALKKHVPEKWCLMYLDRWLNTPVLNKNGELILKQGKGTPQGGVVALLTHPQTLRLSGKLKSVVADLKNSFDYFIKGITFVNDEKIRKHGIGGTHQSCVLIIISAEGCCSYTGRVEEDLRCFSNTSLPVHPTSQEAEGSVVHSGEDDCFYGKAATQSDRQGQELCCFPGSFHQQGSPGCPGRILSREGSWEKRRRSLTFHSPMTACGSRNSHRFTNYWFQTHHQQQPHLHPHVRKP